MFSKVSGISSGKWLLFYDSVTPLNEFFRDIHIPLDSQFLVAQWSSHEQARFTEVYHIDHRLPLQIKWVGNWSFTAGLTWTNTSHVHRRSDLQGLIIKSGFIDFVSFSTLIGKPCILTGEITRTVYIVCLKIYWEIKVKWLKVFTEPDNTNSLLLEQHTICH